MSHVTVGFGTGLRPEEKIKTETKVRRPIYVYRTWANVDVDAPLYRITRSEAAIRLFRGFVRSIDEDKVELVPPRDSIYDQRDKMISGLFDEAWFPRWSLRYLVWQMRPEDA